MAGPPIINKSGSIEFFRRFREWLAGPIPLSYGVTANVVFGAKSRARQDNQGPGGANRIVLAPSDDDGRGSKLDAAYQAGEEEVFDENNVFQGTQRQIASYQQLWTCSVWAVDPQAPKDEERQLEATEDLFQWAYRAVFAVGMADVTPVDYRLTSPTVDSLFGKEARFTFILRQPIFDIPLEAGTATGRIIRP